MNAKTSAAVWAALLLAPAAAMAQSPDRTGFYGSAGYAQFDPQGARDADVGAVSLRAGYQFNRYLGLEAEGALGVDDGHFSTSAGARGTYGLDYLVGAFAVARYPVTDNLDVFARGGVVHAKFKGKARIGNTVARFGDEGELFAGGAGLQYNLGDRNALRGEFTRYEDNDDADFNVWSLSFVRRF